MPRPHSTMSTRIPNKDISISVSVSALRVFWAMRSAGVKLKRSTLFRILSAAATLGTLAEGYAQNGYGREALELYRQMCLDGAKPNGITFLNILNACSHAGLLDDGHDVLKAMIEVHYITPSAEHYVCMIDLLCRFGYLVEAEDLINNMPFQTDSVTWTIVLGASRTHGNVALGAVAAGILVELDPENASPYILLSNIYAAAGRWEDAFKVRQALEERVLKKRSRFEVDDKAHILLSGDTSHRQWE